MTYALTRGPQVDHVALGATLASKHWKTLSSRWTLKVRPRPSPRWIGQAQRRCGPLPRSCRQAELLEHLGQRQLLFDVREVDGRVLADRSSAGYTAVTGRGDHFLSRLLPACGPRPGSVQ